MTSILLDPNAVRQKVGVINERNSFSDDLIIPCINCNSLIPMEEVETHSNICTFVKHDVYEADLITNENKQINYKLWKLEDNLLKMKHKKNFEKERDCHYILTLLQYISDTLSNII